MITEALLHSLNNSVLGWLATVSADGWPNVSPKEAFLEDGQGHILVAHIASRQTVENIRHHPKVCFSFVDVFVQKGYKIHGTARVLQAGDPGFQAPYDRLKSLVGDHFDILAVIEITPERVSPIIAPSYLVRQSVTELTMIAESLETYQVKACQARVNDVQE